MPRPTDTKMYDLLELTFDVPPGRFGGMTYEEGIRYTLEWVLGETSDAPLEEGDF